MYYTICELDMVSLLTHIIVHEKKQLQLMQLLPIKMLKHMLCPEALK